jgi:hypothetical protein
MTRAGARLSAGWQAPRARERLSDAGDAVLQKSGVKREVGVPCERDSGALPWPIGLGHEPAVGEQHKMQLPLPERGALAREVDVPQRRRTAAPAHALQRVTHRVGGHAASRLDVAILPRKQLVVGAPGPARAVQLGPGAQSLFSGSWDGLVVVLDPTSNRARICTQELGRVDLGQAQQRQVRARLRARHHRASPRQARGAGDLGAPANGAVCVALLSRPSVHARIALYASSMGRRRSRPN